MVQGLALAADYGRYSHIQLLGNYRHFTADLGWRLRPICSSYNRSLRDCRSGRKYTRQRCHFRRNYRVVLETRWATWRQQSASSGTSRESGVPLSDGAGVEVAVSTAMWVLDLMELSSA